MQMDPVHVPQELILILLTISLHAGHVMIIVLIVLILQTNVVNA